MIAEIWRLIQLTLARAFALGHDLIKNILVQVEIVQVF